MITKSQSVVERELAGDLPLVRGVPLHLRQPQIGKRTRRRFLVVSEVADQRVRIRVTRVAESGGVVAVVAGKVENTGPLPAGRFVQKPFVINAKLRNVIAVRDERLLANDGLM